MVLCYNNPNTTVPIQYKCGRSPKYIVFEKKSAKSVHNIATDACEFLNGEDILTGPETLYKNTSAGQLTASGKRIWVCLR